MLQIVNFGEIPFADQLKAVHDAAVLTGIHGSDLLNAIFLPSRGALVEIAPQNRGSQVLPPPSKMSLPASRQSSPSSRPPANQTFILVSLLEPEWGLASKWAQVLPYTYGMPGGACSVLCRPGLDALSGSELKEFSTSS